MDLHLEVVRGCEQHCMSCTSGDLLNYMSRETFATAIDRFDKRIEKLRLYGLGETFLHPSLVDILSVRDLFRYQSIIKTNGLGHRDNYDAALGTVRQILVCMDGIKDDTHKLTRTTDLDMVQTVIVGLAAQPSRTQVGIYMLIHGRNYQESPDVVAWARRLGVHIELSPYVPLEIGVAKPRTINEHLMMTDFQRKEFIAMWRNQNVKMTHHLWTKKVPHVNGALIAWDGSVRQCFGRMIDLNDRVETIPIEHITKDCSSCPVNTVTTRWQIPPNIVFGTDSFVEEFLYECSLDPWH